MKKILIFSFLLLTLIVLSISFYAWKEYQRFLQTPLNIDNSGYVYKIEQGSNIRAISQDLVERQLTNLPAFYFEAFARYHQKSSLIKAGEYQLQSNTTLPAFLEQIIEGKVLQYRYTVVEGMTSQQLIEALTANEQLLHTLSDVTDNELLTTLAATETHLEGLFLPETYHFPAGTSDVEFLKRAYQDLKVTLEAEWANKAEDLPYETPYEALIMASIIEKETGIAEERAQIAGVFVRRLKKGMRLQTDPTVIYGMGENYDGNIRRKDLRTDTPYNTYTRHGLPPTPIALASKESIYAALHPADGKSLYFVATGKDGRHYFSSTLAEHNKAVRKYQLKK